MKSKDILEVRNAAKRDCFRFNLSIALIATVTIVFEHLMKFEQPDSVILYYVQYV